jgi:hypothetical protein
MVLRHGYYSGLAIRMLDDKSYAWRWCGRAQELTEEDYRRETSEICERLVARGIIRADEDPWESGR